MTRAEILRALGNSALGGLTERIGPMLRESVRLQARKVDPDDLLLGTSRIGGVPDVPTSFSWPHVEEKPMAFIAQLDLSELARFDAQQVLPTTGWLCFFYEAEEQPWGFDPADRGKWRVVYFTCGVEDLTRAVPPILPEFSESSMCAVSYKVETTLPPIEELEETGLIRRGTSEWDAYWPEEIEEALCPEDEPRHRTLGNPNVIQGDMRLECQLASNGVYCGDLSSEKNPRYDELRGGWQDWILLLQIDTDEEGPGWMWGDCGRIYYWIRKQDLAARNFDNVWLVLQCY